MIDRDALLRSRCSSVDWRIWQERSRVDDVHASLGLHRRRVDAARAALVRFCSGERGYIGVSWGKDSCAVLLLSIMDGVDWPVVHVALDPVSNPDCDTTRDAWLEMYPGLALRYHEIRVRCHPKPSTSRYDTNAAYTVGFADAARRFGQRRVSGVRAEEATARKLAVLSQGLGEQTDKTARPIGRWRSEDVFAFLRDHPLAPAYPCTMSGSYDRGRVRVNNLWGLYGEGHGRRDWEWRYYRDRIAEIERQHAKDVATSRA